MRTRGYIKKGAVKVGVPVAGVLFVLAVLIGFIASVSGFLVMLGLGITYHEFGWPNNPIGFWPSAGIGFVLALLFGPRG